MSSAFLDPAATDVMILAGGLGTRLRSVVADRQKAVAEVNGRPFIHYLLDRLATSGFRRAILCTGVRREQVERLVGDRYGALSISYSPEEAPLGTGGALRLAATKAASRVVLVLNGDSYCDADLGAFARWHCEKGARASILLARAPAAGRYGRVAVDAGGEITAFEEKGDDDGPGVINAGVYLVERERLLEIPSSRPVSIEREAFPNWIGAGFFGYEPDPPPTFVDIGTPSSFREAEAILEVIEVNPRSGASREGTT